MPFLRCHTLLLILSLLAVMVGNARIWQDDDRSLAGQPFGESSESNEVELESESDSKDGFERSYVPSCLLQVFVPSALQSRVSAVSTIERVVLEQNAPRPPPITSI